MKPSALPEVDVIRGAQVGDERMYRELAQQSRMREFLRHMAGPVAVIGTPLAPGDKHD